MHLSAIRSLHVKLGYPLPPTTSPRVKLALKAPLAAAPPPLQRAPITLDILRAFATILAANNIGLFWMAVFYTAFFGALRGGEYATQFIAGSGWTQPLTIHHLQFYHQDKKLVAKISIPRTKTLW